MKLGKLGDLHIARISRTSNGMFAGRHLPREKLADPRWMALLELESPPDDGLYIPRSQVRNGNAPAAKSKEGSKSLPVRVLYNIAKAAATYDAQADARIKAKAKSTIIPKQTPSQLKTKPPLKATGLGELTIPPDWNDLSPDSEAQLLGVEQVPLRGSVTVIGAGISGLVFSWILSRARPDIHIRIVDSKHEVGGWMHSVIDEEHGQVIESGPRTLLPSHPGTEVLLRILRELDALDLVGGVPRDAATNRKGLIFDDKVVTMPQSFSESLKFLSSAPIMKGARWRLLKDFWTPPRSRNIDDESVHQFFARRLGPLLADRMLSAIMRGIYGGDARKLSARSVARLGKLYYLERTEQMSILGAILSGSSRFLDKYSAQALPLLFDAVAEVTNSGSLKLAGGPYSLLGFPNTGIQGLAQVIAANLKRRSNVEISLDTPVAAVVPVKRGTQVEIRFADASAAQSDVVVSTIAQPNIFREAASEAATILDEVSYTNIAVVNVWTPEHIAKDWFGILVPQTEDKHNPDGILGIIFDSSVQNAMVPIVGDKAKLFPHRHGSNMTVMIGGDLWPAEGINETEARDRALRGLKRWVGNFDAAKAEVNVSLQLQCIPQYHVGHSKRVHAVHEELTRAYSGRVAVIGTTLGRGVGVSDCVVDALTLATRFADQRKVLHPKFWFNHWYAAMRPEYFA